jgi:hypothetical protein
MGARDHAHQAMVIVNEHTAKVGRHQLVDHFYDG